MDLLEPDMLVGCFEHVPTVPTCFPVHTALLKETCALGRWSIQGAKEIDAASLSRFASPSHVERFYEHYLQRAVKFE